MGVIPNCSSLNVYFEPGAGGLVTAYNMITREQYNHIFAFRFSTKALRILCDHRETEEAGKDDASTHASHVTCPSQIRSNE